MAAILNTVARFEIPFSRYLDAASNVVQALPAFAENPENLIALYSMMVLTRLFDKKAINLQRIGKLGTYPSSLGQEAIYVGIGAAMLPEDVLCPYYRDIGAQFWRGVTMEEILLYWGGDEMGSDFKKARQDFPINVPIASQTLHAVGVGAAFQYRNESRVALTTIGDGGTSRGDFYEALNVAGVWNLPVVFVVNNNQWAISVPRAKQTHAQTLAQKGIAAGVMGIQIDGNDVIAVKQVVAQALNKARKGDGPTLIEAISYRMCDHTTADDASRYRTQSELAENEKKDPVLRLKNYMINKHFWDQKKQEALEQEMAEKVSKAAENYLMTPIRRPESMFEHLYQTLPKQYENQVNELHRRGD